MRSGLRVAWRHSQDAAGGFDPVLCNFPNHRRAVTLPAVVEPKAKTQSFGPAHFINRELSWLEFNHRVLEEALDPQNPLLERVKFFCIVSSNLDEFFEVRVAGLKQQIESEVVERTMDGLTGTETLRAIVKRVRRMVEQQYACWRDELVPALAANGIRLLELAELEPSDLAWVEDYYHTQVRPVLTPLAIDPAHPFPQLLNKTLNLIVRLEMTRDREAHKHMAVVQIPRNLPRVVKLLRLRQILVADRFPYHVVLAASPHVELDVDALRLGRVDNQKPALPGGSDPLQKLLEYLVPMIHLASSVERGGQVRCHHPARDTTPTIGAGRSELRFRTSRLMD